MLLCRHASSPTFRIPAIGLGAMPLTTEEYPDDRKSAAAIHAALDAGIRLIDTADAYAPDDYGRALTRRSWPKPWPATQATPMM